jgi:outer membrane receptor for ferrienterochelin and colicins
MMKPVPKLFAALLSALLIKALVGAAQTLEAGQEFAANPVAHLSIEQLLDVRVESVYGASRYEQKTTRAPSSVSIVTREEITKLGSRTLADVLRTVPGVYVTYDRNYSNIGVRGFARPGDFNTRVLLLLDGHRMNDNLYGSALIGREAMLDVDLIERVEIVRGPSSSLYGNSAFFGVINVITRKGAAIDGVEASAEAGSWDTFKGRFTYGKQYTNGLELVVSGTIFDSAGQSELYYEAFDNPQNNFGIAEDADGEYAHNLFGRLSYGDFTLSGGYALRRKRVPTASFGTVFNDGRQVTTDDHHFLDLKYERNFSEDLRVMGRVYYDSYTYRAKSPYNFAPPGDPPFLVVTRDNNVGDGIGAEFQLTRKFFDRHTLVVGGEYRRALSLVQANLNDDGSDNYRIERHGWWSGAYAQSEIAIRTNLLLNLGLRYDQYSHFGGTINPRAALIYSPWEQTTFKLLYGQAYRAPNAYELYLDAPGFNKANPDLDPETIRTYELVYEQSLPYHHTLSLSGYFYEIANLITQTYQPAENILMFENINKAKAKGVELGLEGRYPWGMRARASYSLSYAEDGDTGVELNNSPRHMAKFSLIAPIYKEYLTAGLDLQYYSSMKALAGNRTPGFVTANLTLFSHEIVKGLEVSATVYNLFDQRYAYPGSTGHFQDSIPQDGRSFRAKLTYKF